MWILHPDNAAHDALRFLEFLAKESITKMDYPPDLAPCDFWLFPKLKKKPLEDKDLLLFLTSNAT
jgi:hypothetical protein